MGKNKYMSSSLKPIFFISVSLKFDTIDFTCSNTSLVTNPCSEEKSRLAIQLDTTPTA